MKKIFITLIVYLLSSSVSIANENNCSGIKKLSKEYLACKAKSIKDNAEHSFVNVNVIFVGFKFSTDIRS